MFPLVVVISRRNSAANLPPSALRPRRGNLYDPQIDRHQGRADEHPGAGRIRLEPRRDRRASWLQALNAKGALLSGANSAAKRITISTEAVALFDSTADAKGMTANAFVSRLLELIVRDNLINAILDEAA